MLRRQEAIRTQHLAGNANVAGHIGVDGAQPGMDGFAAVSQIAQTKFLWIATDLVGELVHLGFDRKRNLRSAQSAIGACRHRVCVNRQAIDLHVGKTIGSDDAIGRLAADHGAVFRIGAGIEMNGGLLGNELAIRIHGGANIHARIVRARGQKSFLDAELQFHGPRNLPRTCGRERLDFRVGLAAVTAAHEGHNYAHAIERQIENFGEIVTHHEGMLRRGINRQLAPGIVIGDGHVRFHGVGVDHGEIKFAFDDVRGGSEGGIHVSPLHVHSLANICFAPRENIEIVEAAKGAADVIHSVNEHGAGRERAGDVEHRCQLVVSDLDFVERFLGAQLVFGYDRGHRLAHESHFADGQQRMILNGMAVVGMQSAEIISGENVDDSGLAPGLGGVYGENLGMRKRAAQKFGPGHAFESNVAGVSGASRHLGHTIAREGRNDSRRRSFSRRSCLYHSRIAPICFHVFPQFRGGLPDRFQYPQIARAAAQVAAHVGDDFFVGGMRVFFQQRFGREDHPRRAEAALKSKLIEKGLLQRMKPAGAIGESFDGGDALIADLVGEIGAGADGKAVDEHGTTATDLRLAG